MEDRNPLCTTQLAGLCFLVCLGCGSPVARPATTPPSEPASVAAGISNDTSSVPQTSDNPVQSPPREVPDGSQSTTENAPSTSTASVDQVPHKPDKPKHVTPTAEQLVRWKSISFDPLQLLAYRENEEAGFVSFVSATNDGHHYLLGGTKLTLWSIDDQEPVHEFVEAEAREDESLLSFAVSPVGNWCIAGNASGLLRKFDIEGRKEIASRLTATNRITKIAISQDGKQIATIGSDSQVVVWDSDSLEKKSTFKIDANKVHHLQYAALHVLIAAGDTMSTWDTVTGNKIKTYPSEKNQAAVALSPDGRELVFGIKDALQRWSMISDQASGAYEAVPFQNSAIRFSTDSNLVAIASGNAIHILDAATGQKQQVLDANGSTISDISWIPQTHLLLVGTDSGQMRIWGSPNEGKALELSPLHTSVVHASHDASDPATVAENLEVVDVRLLPKMPNAKPQSESFNSVTYSAPVSVEEFKTFYRYILGERGWEESSDQATEYSIPFQKNGYTLIISPFGDKVTETFVSLSLSGNYDIRMTPRLNEFLTETMHEERSTIVYKVRASLLQIETELLRKLHLAGWTSAVRLISRQNDELNGRNLEFLKNGTGLRVRVQPDEDDASLYVVSYSTFLLLHALPVPPDAGLIEWDDYFEAQLVANTSLSLEEATAFYEDTMKKQGWLPGEARRRIDSDVVYLPYYRGQLDVTISLNPVADGLVRIRAGKYSDASWQKPEEEVAKDSTTESTPGEGLEAADVPILHAVGAPAYSEERGGDIRFELERISLIDLAKEYEAVMSKLGWTAKAFGDPLEDSVGLHFEKGGKIIYYSSSIDPRGIGIVHFSGNGLLWTKAIPSKQLISYSTWLRNNKFPATLSRLGDYQAQMEMLAR